MQLDFMCKNILQDVGLNYAWMNNDVTHVKFVCNEVQKRLQLQLFTNLAL